MLDNIKMLGLYREEKNAVAGCCDTFPSFREWKELYLNEYFFSHQGSSFINVDVAMELTDADINSLSFSIDYDEID